MNAITLRSGVELEAPKMAMREDKSEVERRGDVEKKIQDATPSEKDATPITLSPYKPYKDLNTLKGR